MCRSAGAGFSVSSVVVCECLFDASLCEHTMQRWGTKVGCIAVVVGWSMLLANADVAAQLGSRRQLAETEAAATSPQHSLLLKVKSRLDDPMDTLASWVPEVGPCEDFGDSFSDGWQFVKCNESTVTQL